MDYAAGSLQKSVNRSAARAAIPQIVQSFCNNYGFPFDANAYGNSQNSLSSEVALLNKSGMNDATGYYTQVQNIILTADDSKAVFTNIVSLETAILADQSLSSSSRQTLLQATSVARFSNYYVQKQIILGNNGPWNGVGSDPVLALSKFWRKVIGADVSGAIVGAIFGGAGGALSGGVGASVGSAVDQLLD